MDVLNKSQSLKSTQAVGEAMKGVTKAMGGKLCKNLRGRTKRWKW
jgi:hypothetical protein